jgi:hypothetical protein
LTKNNQTQLLRAEELWSSAGLSPTTAILGPVGELDVAPLLGWREVLDREPASGDSVIAVVGESPLARLADFYLALAGYPVGVDVCLLVGDDLMHFCDLANLSRLSRCEVSIRAVATMAYPQLRVGVVLSRVKARKGESAEQLRDRIIGGAFPGLYQALQDAYDSKEQILRSVGSHESLEELRDKLARIERELDITRARAHAVSARLDHVEASATWRAGSLVTQVARDPRQILSATRGAFAIFRTRRNRIRGTASSASASMVLNGDQVLGNFVLHGLQNDTLVALVGSSDDRVALSTAFAVVTLAPHDCVAKLESARPKYLVISTDAARSDSLWCYLGSASGVDKEAALLAAIKRARALDIPAILVKKGHVVGWRSIELASDSAVMTENEDLTKAVGNATKLQTVRG